MAFIRSFKDLEVWREAHRLTKMMYQTTSEFPRHEQFGLALQLRRAAVSIPANIAEGSGRRTTKELLQFLTIANGSLEEVRYYCLLAHELNYFKQEENKTMEKQCGSVGRLIGALARSLRLRLKSSRAPVTGHRSPTAKR